MRTYREHLGETDEPRLVLADPSDNRGRGWKRLSSADLVGLIYIALKLTPRRFRSALYGRDAQKSDDAARAIAGEIAGRLRAYPIFGPDRPAPGPSIGGPGSPPRNEGSETAP